MNGHEEFCSQRLWNLKQCYLILKLFFTISVVAQSISTVAADDAVDEISNTQDPYLLSSLPKYEQMHVNANRTNNVDVVDHGDGTQTLLCRLATMLPFSKFDENGTEVSQPWGSPAATAGALLAAHHFNTGNGSIIKEIDGINDRCDIRFTAQINNTYANPSRSVNTAIALTDEDSVLKPCAFLGGFASSVSTVTSLVTGLRGYPQFGALSTSAQLDDTSQYPLFGRLIPSDGADGTSVPLIAYYRSLGVQHLVVLHTNEAYGNAFASAIQKAALESEETVTVKSVEMVSKSTPESIKVAVQGIKETGYRHIFAVIHGSSHYEDLMTEAYTQGIAGDGKHSWIFGDNLGIAFSRSLELKKNSALYRASHGIGMIAGVGGVSGMPTYDKLTLAIQDLDNEADKNYLLSLLPENNDDPEYLRDLINSEDFFKAPARASPFLYDTIMLLGLAACKIIERKEALTGENHFQEALKTTFQGSTGFVELNKATGTRVPTSAVFNIYNFVLDDSGNKATLKDMLTDVFSDREWKNRGTPFVYNDNTTEVPLDLPKQNIDYGYIGTGLRAVGLCMAALVIVLSVGFSLWTHKMRESRVVKASQPFFLHIICLGTLVLASTTIPLSIDDEIASVRGCEIACQSSPWLAATGFTFSFSALFAKTLRVNMIFQSHNFSRVVVTIYDVIKPMGALLGANVVVLTLLTIFQPVKWERNITEEDEFGRESESRGFCVYENHFYYTLPLCAINLGVLVLALVQAYRARKISTEFAESEYIAKALVCVVLVCFIGIPVIIIVQGEPKAFFFVIASIIFVMCSSLLLLIFVPKVIFHMRKKARESRKTAIRSSMQPSRMASTRDSDEEGLKVVNLEQQQKDTIEENKLLQQRTRELEMKVRALESEVHHENNDDHIVLNTDVTENCSDGSTEKHLSEQPHKP